MVSRAVGRRRSEHWAFASRCPARRAQLSRRRQLAIKRSSAQAAQHAFSLVRETVGTRRCSALHLPQSRRCHVPLTVSLPGQMAGIIFSYRWPSRAARSARCAQTGQVGPQRGVSRYHSQQPIRRPCRRAVQRRWSHSPRCFIVPRRPVAIVREEAHVLDGLAGTSTRHRSPVGGVQQLLVPASHQQAQCSRRDSSHQEWRSRVSKRVASRWPVRGSRAPRRNSPSSTSRILFRRNLRLVRDPPVELQRASPGGAGVRSLLHRSGGAFVFTSVYGRRGAERGPVGHSSDRRPIGPAGVDDRRRSRATEKPVESRCSRSCRRSSAGSCSALKPFSDGLRRAATPVRVLSAKHGVGGSSQRAPATPPAGRINQRSRRARRPTRFSFPGRFAVMDRAEFRPSAVLRLALAQVCCAMCGGRPRTQQSDGGKTAAIQSSAEPGLSRTGPAPECVQQRSSSRRRSKARRGAAQSPGDQHPVAEPHPSTPECWMMGGVQRAASNRRQQR